MSQRIGGRMDDRQVAHPRGVRNNKATEKPEIKTNNFPPPSYASPTSRLHAQDRPRGWGLTSTTVPTSPARLLGYKRRSLVRSTPAAHPAWLWLSCRPAATRRSRASRRAVSPQVPRLGSPRQ